MIVCISANPALDVRLRLDELRAGCTQRVRRVERLAGGKGAHVAFAAHAMNAPVLLVGFFGGPTGRAVQRQLAEAGIPVLPVSSAAPTRQNLEIVDDQARTTELLEPGGPIEPEEVEALISACVGLLCRLGPKAILVLSGSLPVGVPADLFARLVGEARHCGATTVVDTSGEALACALAARPHWVKPNHEEASALLGTRIVDEESALAAARAFQERGAERVVLSRGREGLVALGEAGAFSARSPAIDGRSAVGAGDAAVAGLAVSIARGAPFEDALRLAAAAGSANCVADTPGRLRASDLERALGQVEVGRISCR